MCGVFDSTSIYASTRKTANTQTYQHERDTTRHVCEGPRQQPPSSAHSSSSHQNAQRRDGDDREVALGDREGLVWGSVVGLRAYTPPARVIGIEVVLNT